MGKYSFVLSDTLYKQYYLFKEHQDYDKDIILHLLKFRCAEFLTNTKQLDDIGIGENVSKGLYNRFVIYITPSPFAIWQAWMELVTCSFSKIFWRWRFTVLMLMERIEAISLLSLPCSMS